MAGAKFQYDESGGTFFYFLLSFLAPVVIPCTYYFWPKDERAADSEKKGGRSWPLPAVCGQEPASARQPAVGAAPNKTLSEFLLVLGWVAMAANRVQSCPPRA
ncbi:hypothetical protein HPB51_009508 [Rhipicephalus microplus]|uniref:Uncharacterized protein n=1 Tax=Rhipicephalus microplus TaxID=6941 RepID=A0A9J6DUB5_RHIMP|nr:hypothetical protein HPB51_009508 [Rhipicephalus microplus]